MIAVGSWKFLAQIEGMWTVEGLAVQEHLKAERTLWCAHFRCG